LHHSTYLITSYLIIAVLWLEIMSFGFGVGDFIAVSRLALDICKKFKDSSNQFKAIRNE
jgi:hypothetical protein